MEDRTPEMAKETMDIQSALHSSFRFGVGASMRELGERMNLRVKTSDMLTISRDDAVISAAHVLDQQGNETLNLLTFLDLGNNACAATLSPGFFLMDVNSTPGIAIVRDENGQERTRLRAETTEVAPPEPNRPQLGIEAGGISGRLGLIIRAWTPVPPAGHRKTTIVV